MKTFCIATLTALLGVANAANLQNIQGPRLSVEINDASLPDGAGSLNLEGTWEHEVLDNVNAGVEYRYNQARGLPTSVWVRGKTDIDEGNNVAAEIKAEYDLESKATVVEATLNQGEDSVTVDYDTATNVVGPVRIHKELDMDGRRVVIEPTVNVQEKTGFVVVNTELDGPDTTAEVTLDQRDESVVVEVSHKLDDSNRISPKFDLKSGDVSVRLNRDLEDGKGAIEVTACKTNVDWEFKEGNNWTVAGNIPLEDTGKSSIAFKRTLQL